MSEDDDTEPFYSTPNYNASILFDCRYKETTDYLNQIFTSSNELSNGLKLFKIWLQQRQLSSVRRYDNYLMDKIEFFFFI